MKVYMVSIYPFLPKLRLQLILYKIWAVHRITTNISLNHFWYAYAILNLGQTKYKDNFRFFIDGVSVIKRLFKIKVVCHMMNYIYTVCVLGTIMRQETKYKKQPKWKPNWYSNRSLIIIAKIKNAKSLYFVNCLPRGYPPLSRQCFDTDMVY